MIDLKPILLDLIYKQEQHVKQMKSAREAFGDVAYNLEYKTVGISTARQTGKTKTICEMYRPGDLIIVSRYSMKACYPREFNVKAACEFDSQMYRGRDNIPQYGYVFIDEMSMFDRSSIREIYEYTRANWYVSLSTIY